jgi:hypothetical protein
MMHDESTLYHHYGHFYLIEFSIIHQLGASLCLGHASNPKVKLIIATPTSLDTFSNA